MRDVESLPDGTLWARVDDEAAEKELVKRLLARYPALTNVEVYGLINSFMSARKLTTTELPEIGEVFNLLGWANTVKLQRTILRKITHGSDKRKLRADVRRGKAGVVENNVDFKGLYFRTMAQQEARMEERIREGRRPGPRKKKLPIGTRVRFVQDVMEEADGDHPDICLARKGDVGKVTGHNDWQGHYVAVDTAPSYVFGATYVDDFVKLAEEG